MIYSDGNDTVVHADCELVTAVNAVSISIVCRNTSNIARANQPRIET